MEQTTIIQGEDGSRAQKVVRNCLPPCGILSSLLYVGADIIAALRYPGYSYTDQMFSELLAIGAPTRPFMIPPMMVYNALVIAFGIGVWLAAGRKRRLRITGILLVAYGIVSSVGPFVPMHLREAAKSLTDTLHIIDTSAIALLTLLFVGFGATTGGKGFRLYSIGTILALVVFGGLAGLQGPRMGAGLPTPWFGLLERVNIYGAMLWVLVLAITLLWTKRGQGTATGNGA